MDSIRRISALRRVAGASLPLATALACSSASGGSVTGFGAPAVANVVSASGALTVTVHTSITPPSTGLMEAQLTVTEQGTGKPVDGLTVAVTPWMPSMTMGSSVRVGVTPQGNGVYLLSNLSLFMPGTWELRTTFTGPMSDTADPEFDVP